jgi:hypothetical protein
MTVGGKSITETLEAKNHPEAIKFVERLVDAKRELTEEVILQLHKLIMSNITEDAGHYRTTGVKITGATFMPPPSSQVKPRIDELLKCLRKNPDELTPIELAAVFHHPFIATVPKLDRPKYLKTLAEADSGNTSSFVNFIARCAERALDMYLDALEEPEILTLAEASKTTPYSQEYLSLLARKGLLGAYKQGRNWVVSRRELDRYLMSVRKER